MYDTKGQEKATERLRDTIQAHIDALQELLAQPHDPSPKELLVSMLGAANCFLLSTLRDEGLRADVRELNKNVGSLLAFRDGVLTQTTELRGMQKILGKMKPAVWGACLLACGFLSAEYKAFLEWQDSMNAWRRNHCMHHIYEEVQAKQPFATECADLVQLKKGEGK